MTEHAAFDWPEIALTREASFSLAGAQVRPAALEIEIDGRVVTLEPRVMKVLTALHRSLGQPVSRDELITLCWGGRIVTEGAINRCVAQLRKALAPNPRIRVDTIATVGYRLQASADVLRVGIAAGDHKALETEIQPSRRWKIAPWWIGGALAAVAVAGVAIWTQVSPRSVVWTASAFRPLTSDPGVETYPALSPNGEQIVYSGRGDSAQRRDLFLRGVNDGAPVRLTSSPADDSAAAWSPRGDRIAFVRYPGQGNCSIVVMPIPGGAERTVAPCQAVTWTRVGWIDDRTLVISDRPTSGDVRRLRTIDIATGAARDLTAPPAITLGDADPQVSPDGAKLVFRRTLAHGADDLFLRDLKSGREQALTDDGWKASGYVWSADSRHVFFSSNRGGAFGLWTVDTRAGGPPKQVALGLGSISFSRMSGDARNRVAVEVSHGRASLSRLTAAGAVEIAGSAESIWDPAASPDGAVAYVSGASGAPEVWVSGADGRAVRLTSLVGSYVSRPTWSADGASLAFLGVKGRQPQVYTVRRDGSQLRAVTGDALDKYDPVFLGDGRIAYIERGSSGWRAMSVTPGSPPQPLAGGEGWRSLRAGPDGRLYGVRNGEDTVLALGAPRAVANIAGADNWAVGTTGVYSVRPRLDRRGWAVWLQPWVGPAREVADMADSAGSLSVGADGAIYMTQVKNDQIDLGLVDLVQRR